MNTRPLRSLVFSLSASLAFAAAASAQSVSSTGDVSPGPVTTPTWNVGSYLVIGDTSDGTLTIGTGGEVSTGSFATFIGQNAGVTGTLLLNGGTFTTTSVLRLGEGAGGVGVLTMNSGNLSAVNLNVGVLGAGTFTLSGGTVATGYTSIADGTGVTGAVTMSGGSWDIAGELNVGSNGTGSFALSGGALTTHTSIYLGNLESTSGNATVTVSGGTWTLNDPSGGTAKIHIGESGTGTFNLTGSGSVTMSGNGGVEIARYSSGTGTLNFGAYDLGAATTAGTLTAHRVAFGSGTGTINFNQTNALTLALPISGTGTLHQRGTGTTTLTSINSDFHGATHVTGGTLVLAASSIYPESALGDSTLTVGAAGTLAGNGWVLGAATVDGTLLPGNATTVGAFDFASDLTLGAGANTILSLAALYDYSRIDVGGLLTYGGTLTVNFLDGYTPDTNASYYVFGDHGGRTGTFNAIAVNAAGWTGVFDHDTGALTFTASAVPEPSTYAALFGVCALGLAVWRRRRVCA